MPQAELRKRRSLTRHGPCVGPLDGGNPMAWTRLLRDVTLDDVASVGGKNASLGEMLRELVPLGVRVPDGFAVTADAFRALMRESHADAFVKDQLAGLSPTDIDDLTRRS